MKKSPKTVKATIVLVIMVVAVLALYNHMVNKVNKSKPETETTVVQNVLLTNLETGYPATPREVVKYYNQIMQCYYNEDCSEEEITALADKALLLFDEELANNQDYDRYIAGLKDEIASYKENDIVISAAAVATSTDVEYSIIDGRKCAKLRCVYTMREKTTLSSVKEIYVLRKDEKDHWKILGWEVYGDEEIK